MPLLILMFICALALSGAAAYYSIIGLIAIFAAAPVPIAIMGTMLEASKLVVASWLYRNWGKAPLLLKSYLVIALSVLMFLTSMGIFGFLSKAHLDQSVPTSDVAAELAIIDDKIKLEQENINVARQTLSQLDTQVNQALARTDTASGVNRSITIRRQQARERAALAAEIEASQNTISDLTKERSPKASVLRKVEAEVGPIKYIAALIYGDQAASEQTTLAEAVRTVIILLVIVFDPLAVIMLIAANWSLKHRDVDMEPELVEEVLPSDKIVEPSPPAPEVVVYDEPQPEMSVEEELVNALEDNHEEPTEPEWRSRPPKKS